MPINNIFQDRELKQPVDERKIRYPNKAIRVPKNPVEVVISVPATNECTVFTSP
jgi:hypothetical protein